MIRYEGFGKRYGEIAAVEDLDLEVGARDAIALIGPNGSGKTTTLKAALGLVKPTRGRVLVDGRDIATDGRAARARIGYLPQRLGFPEGCDAREVMRFYAKLRGAPADSIDGLLARVGLTAAAKRVVDGYSGGMRQRLGIAIALLGSPRVLVLDEPTAALDPSGALDVRDILAGIRADGIGVLLSSHDLAEVAAVADRIGVFDGGRLKAFGTAVDLARAAGLASADLEQVYRALTGARPRRAA